ncbi:MAG: CPBP family intramembrane glutamic endopeptidase [Gammaproteobacteria bacterium]
MNEIPPIRSNIVRASHGLVLLVLIMATGLVPVLRDWPWFWLASITAYFLLVAVVPLLRASFRPWRFGRVSTFSIAATVVIAAGSCAVLVVFHVFNRSALGVLPMLVPHRMLGSVFIAGAVVSVLNALFEEIAFRGVFFDAIEAVGGAWVAVAATAAVFGFAHMHGYPPTPIGAFLAGIYGLALGWLRLVTGGIGFPVIAHIAADATIFTIAAFSGIL